MKYREEDPCFRFATKYSETKHNERIPEFARGDGREWCMPPHQYFVLPRKDTSIKETSRGRMHVRKDAVHTQVDALTFTLMLTYVQFFPGCGAYYSSPSALIFSFDHGSTVNRLVRPALFSQVCLCFPFSICGPGLGILLGS
jgi:hypothetical protein